MPISAADPAYRTVQDAIQEARDWISQAGGAKKAQDFYKQKEILSHAYVLILQCPVPVPAVTTSNV